MFELSDFIDIPPYSFRKNEKRMLYQKILRDLIHHHYRTCLPYQKILDLLLFDVKITHSLENIPFIPARLFKMHDLFSVDRSNIHKTLHSSGTSGQPISKIFLDRLTSTAQTKALTKILSNFLGSERLPMLIIDHPSVLKNRNLFSARGAGVLGFSMLGRDITYALDENMQLDITAVKNFLKKYQNKVIFLFGFTHIVWEFFYKKIFPFYLDFRKAILIHGGGWKKMQLESVDNVLFKKSLYTACGLRKIFNYYGMVEQMGSIFMECEKGYLHCSLFSDVVTRRDDFSLCKKREPGILQLFSLLPQSYPGHSILSEDIGEILGEDDCDCGRLGKYFIVHGRIQHAEIRGCSDVVDTR